MITKFSSLFVFLISFVLLTPFAIVLSVLRGSADTMEWVLGKACYPFDRTIEWLERR